MTGLMKFLRRCALSVVLAAAALPAHAETLGDTLAIAYRNSALLDQNRALLRVAQEDVAGAVAGLRPIIQWVASHRYSDNFLGMSQLNTSLQLQGQMTLYDFGRSRLAIDIAKEGVLATRQALLLVEQDVLLEAVAAYVNMISAQEQVDLRENALKLIAQQRQAAQDRFDVGEITITDVALADARLEGERAGLAAAQGQLDVARENYKAAVGQKPGSISSLPKPPDRPASLSEAQAIAQRTNPAIRQAQREVARAELQVAAAMAERRPTISASAGIGLTRAPDPRRGGDRDTVAGGQIGIEANQTVYSGGRLSSLQRTAQAGRDAARSALLRVARQVAQAVGSAWANIDVAVAQLSAIDQQIVAAEKAYNGLVEEAALGARTTLDVLDAHQNLLEARADRISAQSQLQLAHYQLLASMGLMTVENLKLGIPTYDPSAYYTAVRDAPYTSEQGDSLERVLRAIGKN